MTLTADRRGAEVVVSVSGCDTIDAANAHEMKSEVLRLMGDATHVVLDLTGVEFLDSAGVGLLVGVFKQARARGSHARLCGLTPGVRQTLELIQLDRIFEIAEAARSNSGS